MVSKKAPSVIKLKPLNYAESMASGVGMQSMKTNDQTVNASRAVLGHKEIDEDSILKEFGSLAPTRKLPMASN